MGRRKAELEDEERPIRPAISPEARESQMISLAIDLAEKQLRNGTASAQVITHYLKLATTKEELEKKVLENRAELLAAQVESIKSSQHAEELYANALEAMRSYGGGSYAETY